MAKTKNEIVLNAIKSWKQKDKTNEYWFKAIVEGAWNSGYKNGIDDAIEVEKSKHRWIPVTEQLPKYMENVLVTDGVFSGMGWRDFYDYRNTKPREDYWIAPSTNVNELGITHWMPLPEPPKEEYKCESCIYNPPSSCDGKPCTQCDTRNPLTNCYIPADKEEK